MLRSRLPELSVLASCLLALASACADDGSTVLDDAGTDAPFLDGGTNDAPPGSPDGSDGAAGDTGTIETGPPDTTPPGSVGDLAGQPSSHVAIALTWTAPGDDPDVGPSGPDAGQTGTVAAYELRYATTPITTLAEFLAATAATGPSPLAAGQPQTASITGLSPMTTYHVVVRARDAAGNFGALSNDATVATKARAKLLITEVAVVNTLDEGFDFVEAVVTEAGWAGGLQIKELSSVLHTIGPVDLAVNDRVVVHATGLPGPAGFAQEDTLANKAGSTAPFASIDAYDVYASNNNLQSTDSLITVNDGPTILDAVALSNRDNNAVATTMTAWAAAKTANAWSFAVTPTDAVNDCESQKDAVNIAGTQQDLACGGVATKLIKGWSVQRVGATDTNAKADFFVGPQTPGAVNALPPAPAPLSAIALSATQVEITFDQEVLSSSVNAAAFTIPGLTVNAAATTNVSSVTLTTSTQGSGTYRVDIAGTVTSTYGAAFAPPFVRFCAFSALPAILAFNEVNPAITLGLDLIELKATRGGQLGGYTVRLNPNALGASGTLLATLPAICAATDDLVVIHLTPAAGTTMSETNAKDEAPTAMFSANYDAAWDVAGGNTAIPFTSAVLAVRDAAGGYIEAVAFSDMAGASSATYLNALTFIQVAPQSLWIPADCGGVSPCSDVTVPSAKSVAASWIGVGTTPAGNSVRRSSVAAQASSWSVGTSSFGLPNL